MSVVAEIAAEIAALGAPRVAIDGYDGAGKTHFAEELAALLSPRPARLSIDDFLTPEEVRYARGRHSPEGFFLDSHDLGAFVEAVRAAPGDRALVVDGIFTHRDELVGLWDYSIWLDVPFEVSIPRGAARGHGFGDPDPQAESNRRYVEGQRLYVAACDPRARATVVVDNSDLDTRRRLRRGV